MVNPKKPSRAAATNPENEEIHAAARSGDLEAVQRICSANSLAINYRDRHSRTPLHLAAWSGHANIVDYLCKTADVGAAAMDDMGAIHFAAQKGHLDVIRILLTSGISVKSTNRKGMTALHYAAQGSHVELVQYLMKKGANVSVKNKVGKTPSDLASNEEVRSVLVNFKIAASDNKEVSADKEKSTEETQSNSGSERIDMITDDVTKQGEEDSEKVDDGESIKRKSDEGNVVEALPEAKKSKVALNHLLAAEDADDEE